eukprot:gnl/Trimastix_PCT/1541.p1 GENE.gnl/Trimastix_PCT/1541~~gnl/Trimastix_PCT/1541.p1  ORF type:complete len:187 (+),score=12.42 gnl/Trimastix_PCT/1541:22-561(+)
MEDNPVAPIPSPPPIEPSTAQHPSSPPHPKRGWWGWIKVKSVRIFRGMQWLGTKFADFFGITASKYQYVVDVHEMDMWEKEKREREEAELRRQEIEELEEGPPSGLAISPDPAALVATQAPLPSNESVIGTAPAQFVTKPEAQPPPGTGLEDAPQILVVPVSSNPGPAKEGYGADRSLQ